MQDPYTEPITPCPACGRPVCLTLAGKIRRHKRAEDIGVSWADFCSGSGVIVDQAFSPATAAIMGGQDGASAPVSVDHELADWWINLASNEVVGLMQKVNEYSAYDLEMVGQMIADTLHLPAQEPGFYPELGCWFYLLGKVARAMGAIRDGKLPSRDTALDTRIYATMILRIKEVGGWPNA